MQRLQSLSITQRAILMLVLITLICFIGVLILLIAPGGQTINASENDTTVSFSVNRRLVNNDDDCVMVSWRIKNAESVFVNDGGRVGEDSGEYCIDSPGEEITLQVFAQDGTEAEYSLYVGLIAFEPTLWMLLFGMGFSLMGIVILLLNQVSQPMRQKMNFVRAPLQFILWLSLTIGATLLVAEFAFQFHISNNGTNREQRMYLYTDQQLREDAVEQPMPFLNIAPIAGGENNSLGYRGDEVVIPKPDDTFRIVALGDSTTHGIGVSIDNTYIAQLETILQEDYDYNNIETVNAGIPGFTTWGHVVNLSFRILELEPDLIIVYTAALDLSALFNAPECYQGYNVHRGIPPNAPIYRVGDDPLPSSALYRFVAIQQGWIDNPVVTNRFITSVIPCDEAAPTLEESIELNPPTYFERNIRTLVGIGMGHDIPVMLSTWGYDAEEEQDDWWLQGIANHNEAIRRVAQETNTLFYDLVATDFIDTADYWFGDGIHQSVEGHRAQAEIYAAFLVEQGLLSD